MSWGTKYKLTWDDLFGQAGELLLQKKDYDGEVTNITGSGNPVAPTFDTPSDFKLDPINGSFITINLWAVTRFQFLDLRTLNNREYRVIYNLDTSLYWKGFILPDQYQEEYKDAPNFNSFIAADQLGFLKAIAWDRTSVETEMTTLGAILEKTDLDLDLYEGINVYEDNHDSTTADSPLNQTYINTKVFADYTYYDALKAILFKYGAVIKQDRGKWVISRPIEAISYYQRRLWTYSLGVFTYSSTALYNPIVSTTSASVEKANRVVIMAGSTTFNNPAWKKYKLTQNYGKIENALENGDFTEWNGNDPEHWIKNGVFTHYREGDSLRVYGMPDRLSERFFQRIYCDRNRASVSVQWEVYVRLGNTLNVVVRIKRQIVGQSTPLFWDFDNNAWTYGPPAPYFQLMYDGSDGAIIQSGGFDFMAWHSFNFGNTEYLEIELWVPVGAATSYVRWKEVKILYTKGGLYDYNIIEFDEETIHDIEINPDNNFDGKEHELLLSDLPDVTGFLSGTDTKKIYKGGMWLDADQLNPTGNWTSPESSGSLVDILKDSISRMHGEPSLVISANICSKLLFSTSIIQDVYNSDTLFMMKRSTLSAKGGMWQTEAHEIGQAGPIPLLDKGEIMYDETGILYD